MPVFNSLNEDEFIERMIAKLFLNGPIYFDDDEQRYLVYLNPKSDDVNVTSKQMDEDLESLTPYYNIFVVESLESRELPRAILAFCLITDASVTVPSVYGNRFNGHIQITTLINHTAKKIERFENEFDDRVLIRPFSYFVNMTKLMDRMDEDAN